MRCKRYHYRLALGGLSVAVAIGLLAVLAAGCTVSGDAAATPSTESVPTVSPAEDETPAVSTPEASTTVSPSVITVTIWTIPLFASGDSTDAAKMLAEQTRLFTEKHPDFHLDWVVKPATGPGSLKEFLLAAQDVAPAILPDVIIFDLRDMGTLVQAGLLQPVDDLMPKDLEADLFAFARNSAQINEEWYSVPFAANIEHLIYDTVSVEAPPLTWADVLSDAVSYGFPAAGQEGRVNDAFLIQYMALGGRLLDEQGLPILDEDPLAKVLTFYADGTRAGLIPPKVLDFQTTEEVLTAYMNGDVSTCNVRSDLYLTSRNKLRHTSFATIPTWNGTVATMGRAVGLGLVTPDASRLEAVKAFAQWIFASEPLSDWLRSAGFLPTRSSVIDVWATEDSYYAFARWQLESAYYAPSEPVYDQVYVALQQAVHDVLVGNLDPAAAANRAVSLVKGKG